MVTIMDTKWKGIAKGIKPDTRRRVVLPRSLVKEDVTFHVYVNNSGQIILDPQVTIPASEAWVFQNPEVFTLAKKGLSDVAEGKVSRIDLKSL